MVKVYPALSLSLSILSSKQPGLGPGSESASERACVCGKPQQPRLSCPSPAQLFSLKPRTASICSISNILSLSKSSQWPLCPHTLPRLTNAGFSPWHASEQWPRPGAAQPPGLSCLQPSLTTAPGLQLLPSSHWLLSDLLQTFSGSPYPLTFLLAAAVLPEPSSEQGPCSGPTTCFS